MNEYELAGVIGTEKFPVHTNFYDGKNCHQQLSNERIVPMLFKTLPPGTQLFIKVPNGSK